MTSLDGLFSAIGGPAPTTHRSPLITILAVVAILAVAGVVIYTIANGKSHL